MQSGERSILIQSPTGSGKTVLVASMLKGASDKGNEAWFIMHRRELVKQSSDTFEAVGLNHGILAAGWEADLRHNTTICSVQTLARRYTRLRRPKVLIWDEAHHTSSRSWSDIHAAFPESVHIGLTATPERLDGTGLGKYFKRMIKGPSVAWLTENGYLAPYRFFAPGGIDTNGIKKIAGDFSKGELAVAADKPAITGDVLAHYLKYADGKRAVVFCVSVEHSRHVVSQFNAIGVEAAHVDGETPTKERDEKIKLFASGHIRVLSNVELFGEGFDLPAIECAILLRPTHSLSLYLQQVGRALRISEGKTEAIILDHAGNCERHGLPDDEREWSLDGRQKKKRSEQDAVIRIRRCPACLLVSKPGIPICPGCGFVFSTASREIEEKAGELVEINAQLLRKQKLNEQRSCRSLEELIELGKRRGYKNPGWWAKQYWDARLAFSRR